MSNHGDEGTEPAIVDVYRVDRDYAIMRLEHIESSDLVGYSEHDFKDIENDFHSAQLKILRPLSLEQRSAEYEVTKMFEMRIKSIKSRLRQASKNETKPVIANNSSNLAKLPKITIKPFDGKLENWISFKELFDSLIHNRDIPNVEKLHYLLISVQGSAYDLIKSFPLSGDSYVSAYETLSKYYNKKRQIAIAYYEKLLHCESVKNKSDLEKVARTFNENLSILSKFDLPDKNFMLFYLLWSKLDIATREAFELQLDSAVDIPKFEDLQDFIDRRSKALENSNIRLNVIQSKLVIKNKSSLVVPSAPVYICPMCTAADHELEQCPSFTRLSSTERFSVIKEKGLCMLCLRPSHIVRNCKSVSRCSECNYRHHTLLHFPKSIETTNNSQSDSQLTTLSVTTCTTQVLFSTAVVHIKNSQGRLVPIRALLDSGSACNFITKEAAHRLGLNIDDCQQSVNGIGQTSAVTLGSVVCEIFPSMEDCSNKLLLQAFVLSRICSDMPSEQFDISTWNHLRNLDLADPHFYKPGPVDMLINVSLLASTLQPGLIKGEPGQPVAVSTIFGWIVMGECAPGTC